MIDSRLHDTAAGLLTTAGIRINGSAPWDIQLRDAGVLERVFNQGNVGLGDAYMDGAWEADRLDEFFCRLLRARLDDKVKPMRLLVHALSAKFLNLQNRRRVWQVGKVHYDLGNEFYAAMLGPRWCATS